jgi:hypothetical protein
VLADGLVSWRSIARTVANLQWLIVVDDGVKIVCVDGKNQSTASCKKMFVPKGVQFNTTLWRKFFYAMFMYNPTGFGTNTV